MHHCQLFYLVDNCIPHEIPYAISNIPGRFNYPIREKQTVRYENITTSYKRLFGPWSHPIICYYVLYSRETASFFYCLHSDCCTLVSDVAKTTTSPFWNFCSVMCDGTWNFTICSWKDYARWNEYNLGISTFCRLQLLRNVSLYCVFCYVFKFTICGISFCVAYRYVFNCALSLQQHSFSLFPTYLVWKLILEIVIHL